MKNNKMLIETLGFQSWHCRSSLCRQCSWATTMLHRESHMWRHLDLWPL